MARNSTRASKATSRICLNSEGSNQVNVLIHESALSHRTCLRLLDGVHVFHDLEGRPGRARNGATQHVFLISIGCTSPLLPDSSLPRESIGRFGMDIPGHAPDALK